MQYISSCSLLIPGSSQQGALELHPILIEIQGIDGHRQMCIKISSYSPVCVTDIRQDSTLTTTCSFTLVYEFKPLNRVIGVYFSAFQYCPPQVNFAKARGRLEIEELISDLLKP